MDRVQNSLATAVLVSETMHIFCCVLPIVFSLASLMAGLGLIGVMPSFLLEWHELMHSWEIPMIITSGVILAVGWGIYSISRKLNCRDTGCHHEPCEPRKDKANSILKIATVLFLINVSVYTFIHREYDAKHHSGATVVIEDQHGHHGHHHE